MIIQNEHVRGKEKGVVGQRQFVAIIWKQGLFLEWFIAFLIVTNQSRRFTRWITNWCVFITDRVSRYTVATLPIEGFRLTVIQNREWCNASTQDIFLYIRKPGALRQSIKSWNWPNHRFFVSNHIMSKRNATDEIASSKARSHFGRLSYVRVKINISKLLSLNVISTNQMWEAIST